MVEEETEEILCEDIGLYLTEYSRNQLTTEEHNFVEKHLNECKRCQIEKEEFEKFSNDLDKIIPSVSPQYEKELVYKILVRKNKESIFTKLVAIVLFFSLLFFLFSSSYSKPKNYPQLKDLQIRAENLFNPDYYSNFNSDSTSQDNLNEN